MKKLLRIIMTAMLLAFAGVASAYVRVDFETGEFNQYPVINNGTYPWVVTNSYYSFDYNVYRMMSGNQGVNNSTSTIEITYNYPNAGMMFFTAYCKPSSGDVCKFYIDGVLKMSASTDGGDYYRQYKYNVNAGNHTFKWEYVKDGSGSSGVDAFLVDEIMFNPNMKRISFSNGDFSEYAFNNSGTYPWLVVNDPSYGDYEMKSGNAGIPNSTSSIEATYNYSHDGYVYYWGWCRGEESSSGTIYDHCRFRVDGSVVMDKGQTDGHENYRYYVTAGSHTFTWEYTKDGSNDPYGDGFFVDDVTFGLNAVDDIALTGFTAPVWGAHPDGSLELANTYNYNVSEVKWYKDKGGESTEMSSSDVFDDEEADYYMWFLVNITDEYSYFADDLRFWINADPDIIEGHADWSGSSIQVVTRDFHVSDPSPAIHNLYVSGFTAPVWGAHPDMTVNVPADAHYSFYQARWVCYDPATEDATIMTASDVFNNENCSYYMEFIFEPESGYSFDPNLTVYINGSTDFWDSEFGGIVTGGLYRAYTIDFYVSPTGVAEQTESIAIWPNPAGNVLHLEGAEGELVRVYDNVGRMVIEQRYEGQLDLSGLVPGIYAVTVAGRTTKFVKE